MRRSRIVWISTLILGILLTGLSACGSRQTATQQPEDWRANWLLAPNLQLQVEASGFHNPTAIAFIPHPGSAPNDPQYFVAEVGGTIKVVTNEGSVLPFADDLFSVLTGESPDLGTELSFPANFLLAGLCLEPANGYVFVTLSQLDEENVRRNVILRLDAQPQTFGLEPKRIQVVTVLPTPLDRGSNHQISNCQADPQQLFVSVGDGARPSDSRDLGRLLGKVLRLSLDGQPLPDNPFWTDDGVSEPADYVWASGFRNPFGIKHLQDDLYIADNGDDIDRFMRVEPGDDFGWNGNDESIASHADVVIVPSVGIGQMDYYAGDGLFPNFAEGAFFIAGVGDQAYESSKDDLKPPTITALFYDTKTHSVGETPQPILKYIGDQPQVIVALAIGPDGLYFAGLLPDGDQTSQVYKLSFDAQNQYPYPLDLGIKDPVQIIRIHDCRLCHSLQGGGGHVGPQLDADVLIPDLEARVLSSTYLRSLDAIDQREDEPYISYRDAREELRHLTGDDRIRAWLKYHLLEPRFDNTYSLMPNLDLTEEEATIMADYLFKPLTLTDRLKLMLIEAVPNLQHRDLVYFFAAGLLLGAVVALGASSLWRFLRKRRQ